MELRVHQVTLVSLEIQGDKDSLVHQGFLVQRGQVDHQEARELQGRKVPLEILASKDNQVQLDLLDSLVHEEILVQLEQQV